MLGFYPPTPSKTRPHSVIPLHDLVPEQFIVATSRLLEYYHGGTTLLDNRILGFLAPFD